MLDFPIVDTHVHLWDTERLHYPWLEGIPALNRPFLLSDYRKACGSVEIETMVFVQCEAEFNQGMDEVGLALAMAEGEPRLEGIVAWAPMEMGAQCREYLARLVAKSPLIKGVRRLIQSEPAPEFCLRESFLECLQCLPDYGLSFDICISHEQLASTITMVRRCPDTSFVLDHIAKPDIKSGMLDPWRQELSELARLPNVVCKISGLVTEANTENWTRDDLKPYIDHVIECFGFDRVMYGGDWPVSTQATDYARWVKTLAWAVAGSSEAEKRKLFRDNAVRVYRLENSSERAEP